VKSEINAAKSNNMKMAYRMQTTFRDHGSWIKHLTLLSKLYGPDCLVLGIIAANCTFAQKTLWSEGRFVPLHKGWDQHGKTYLLKYPIRAQDTVGIRAALVQTDKQRGLWWDFGYRRWRIWGRHYSGQKLKFPTLWSCQSSRCLVLECRRGKAAG